VDELTDAAHAALAERGSVAPAVLTKVSQTLRAASVDKEASKALTSGTLVDEVEQAGFGPLLSAVPKRRRGRAPRKVEPKAAPKPKPDPTAKQRARVEEQLEKARARVRELEERLEQLR